MKIGDGTTNINNLPFINNSSIEAGKRKYVEEFKTNSNTWNDAFAELFSYCETNHYIACTNGSMKDANGNIRYDLTAPLYIGNIDVDFENCELYNNTVYSDTNPACVVLTGALNKIQKFGTVTGRQSIGILVNTANNLYKYNKVYAKIVQGYNHALSISTTNYTCSFNEFHIPFLKSSTNPLNIYSASVLTKWANECYFYLGSIDTYRETVPTKLIQITNASRCNFYNVDLECGVYEMPNRPADPNHTVEVELTNCHDIAFYNPRVKEDHNAVQFRFIGECFDNFIDAEYSKYGTIDCSQLVASDHHFNVWRGRTVTTNAGCVTNMDTLRIYKDMIVPEILYPMIKNVTSSISIDGSTALTTNNISDKVFMGGIPTLLRWSAGDITLNKRFIALLPTTIKVMRVTDEVGNILDDEGNVIIQGSKLTKDKLYGINVNGISYTSTDATGENQKIYSFISDVDILVGDSVPQVDAQVVTHEFGDGFIRGNGTQNTTSTNYKHTGIVEYIGGSIEFRAITSPSASSWSIIAFYDANKTFLGNIETAVGGQEAFYNTYNTKEYETINGSAIDADVVAGTITAEQIAEWYPTTAYIAVSCPIAASGVISSVYAAVENPYLAKQIVEGSGSSEGIFVPAPTPADEGKFLQVINGAPTWVSIPNAEEATF